jgi:hypothetical protein
VIVVTGFSLIVPFEAERLASLLAPAPAALGKAAAAASAEPPMSRLRRELQMQGQHGFYLSFNEAFQDRRPL